MFANGTIVQHMYLHMGGKKLFGKVVSSMDDRVVTVDWYLLGIRNELGVVLKAIPYEHQIS